MAFTGERGVTGLEGQAVVTAPLPIGGQRSGTILSARAAEREAIAGRDLEDLDVRAGLLTTLARFLEAQALAGTAREEQGGSDSLPGSRCPRPLAATPRAWRRP